MTHPKQPACRFQGYRLRGCARTLYVQCKDGERYGAGTAFVAVSKLGCDEPQGVSKRNGYRKAHRVGPYMASSLMLADLHTG